MHGTHQGRKDEGVERVLPAMPIGVEYVSGALDYRLERKRGEDYFIICLPDNSKSLAQAHLFCEGFELRINLRKSIPRGRIVL